MADQSINYTVQVCVIKPSPKAEAGDLLVDGMTVTTTTTMCRAVGRSSEYIRRCVCLCMCDRNSGTAAAAAALTSVVTPHRFARYENARFCSRGRGRGVWHTTLDYNHPLQTQRTGLEKTGVRAPSCVLCETHLIKTYHKTMRWKFIYANVYFGRFVRTMCTVFVRKPYSVGVYCQITKTVLQT